MDSNEERKLGRAALDIMKVGAGFVPFAGPGLAGLVEVVEDRRKRRIFLLLQGIVEELGERIEVLETANDDDRIADIVDDAVEKAARTRSDSQIRLLSKVAAKAFLGAVSDDYAIYTHALMASISTLRPEHVEILLEIGTRRNVHGDVTMPIPSVGTTTPRSLSMRRPHLASLMPPLLKDLESGGLIQISDDTITAVTKGASFGQPAVSLTQYGLWVLEQLLDSDAEDPGHGGA
jgi:hypothetical protein